MVLAALQAGFRQREERVTVLVPARMRVGPQWTDVVIHNVSSRGLMAGSDVTPQTGSYVEIRRGAIVIVARVMWAKGRFFGVRTQDRISAGGLVNEPRLASKPAAADDARGGQDRRAATRMEGEARLARRVERSRALASALQFALIAAVAGTLAVLAGNAVFGVLSRPAAAITAAMGGAPAR